RALNRCGGHKRAVVALGCTDVGFEAEVSGSFRQGACSTELSRASGRLRRETLVSGLMVRKFLSFRAAKFRLKPFKLFVRKAELRISELMASPYASAKASRKVNEASCL